MTGHVYILGEIGKQVTLDSVLKSIDPKFSDYIVHIHSPGGEVFEGYAIYNALKNTGKNIIVQVEGTCASIATLIASAGDKIIMNLKSSWMIHSPRVTSIGGTSRDLRNAAGQLDKIESQLIDSWVGRTTLTREQLKDMYDHETWLDPTEAVSLGFADEVQEVLKAVASADIKNYKKMDDNKVLGAIDKLTSMIANFFAPKNMTDTLQDGRKIMVQSEDGDWTGKPITLEDGTPLEDGNYNLAGGRTITVAGGKIAEVKEPEAIQEENPEDMELKQKLAAAEARIKELESAVQAQTETATQAVAKAKTFENKLNTDLKAVQDELAKIKNTTVGDDALPAKATQEAKKGDLTNNPMAAFFKQNIIDVRNTD